MIMLSQHRGRAALSGVSSRTFSPSQVIVQRSQRFAVHKWLLTSATQGESHYRRASMSTEARSSQKTKGHTVKVGNTLVGKIGHGLMSMTWLPSPAPDEVAFESIKASLDSVPNGVKMVLNAAEFYGEPKHLTANLELVARFFEKYPEYSQKAFLSVKGGMVPGSFVPDGSDKNLVRSVDKCLEALRGAKRIDLFEPARLDRKVALEDQLQTLMDLQDEGKFDYIGLSEVRADTIRRATKITPIAMVEIEISPISYEEETKRVIEMCKELGIAVSGYSPMGKGLLTGALAKLEDIPTKDHRRMFSRFKGENFDHNRKIALALKEISERKGITLPQLCIAWVSTLGGNVIPIPGSSHKSRTEENLKACSITLTPDEIAAVNAAVAKNPPKGGRTIDGIEEKFFLWA